ncbi:MAG: 3-dehydroquinate synthase family protein, partial [Bacillota bacterium]|nr:3-dehydroquinate synthase family protein [Bacillota bacterium]
MSFNFEVIRKSLVQVHVGSNILGDAGILLRGAGVKTKAIVITHDEVNALYGATVKSALESTGIECKFVSIPSGENHKQWNTIARILPILQFEKMDRSCAIGSLGGGVAGDLAGYLASIYMRGLKLFHMPTTLLAQVDSALGGKTAVNYQKDKNILGTYYQPCAIIADVDTLQSLPAREFSAGMAEVVKTGLLAGEKLMQHVEQLPSLACSNVIYHVDRALPSLQSVIEHCLHFKSQIVMQDELDLGPRQQLNLGHTFAHAFEGAGGFIALNHGEAVGLGLLCALRLSQIKFGCSPLLEQRTRSLLEKFNLPTT